MPRLGFLLIILENLMERNIRLSPSIIFGNSKSELPILRKILSFD